MSRSLSCEAFFLPVQTAAGGQRFCLLHAPLDGKPRGALVYVHPFAEEMNKSRHMAALQSRTFAAAGYAVLQMDLLGCGDSSGDFADATWCAWVDDVVQACAWLRSRFASPLWIWGLRAGCLLAAEATQRLAEPASLLFWQPSPSGASVLQQFLRLETVGKLLAGAKVGVDARSPRDRLNEGESVDVAGYRVAPSLAQGLQRATLTPRVEVRQLRWLEVATSDDATLPPGSVRTIEQWRAAGCAVSAQVVHGPAFWQTAEIEDAPQLLTATLESLRLETARP